MNRFFSTFIIIIISFSYYFFAQVGINTATPNAKAVLDLTSTKKGLLPPRMREAQRKVSFLYNVKILKNSLKSLILSAYLMHFVYLNSNFMLFFKSVDNL